MPPLEANYDESMNKTTDSVDDPKWIKLFPRCVADPDKSSNFMTRAIFVAFSVILHRREILPVEYFNNNHITEKIKCLTLAFQNPGALAISQKLKAAGEAIKKGYLKEISLVLTKNEDEEAAIEVYSFKFHYYKNGSVMAQLTTKSGGEPVTPLEKLAELDYEGTIAVRDQLVTLVRSVVYITQKVLGPLPKDFCANFRVHYTDEAPDDFRIAGFADSDTFYTLPQDTQSATLGHVRPGYQGALLECASVFMNDAYQAETGLKRHHTKVADALGYDMNSILYRTIDSESDEKNATQTSTGTATPSAEVSEVGSQKSNSTIDHLSTTFDQNATVTTPMKTRASRRSAGETAKTRPSPYSKPRSRK